jgi:hypothetical protein
MNKEERYILIESIFTVMLLLFVVALFGERFARSLPYFMSGIAGGGVFSWFMRKRYDDRYSLRMHTVITVGLLVTIVWIVVTLLNSSLRYNDIILVWVRGGLFLEIILSFAVFSPAILAYMQLLSLPLCMASFLFFSPDDVIPIVFLFSYTLCWGLLLRIKFYHHIGIDAFEKMKERSAYYLPLTVLVVSVIGGIILLVLFPFKQLKGGGFWPSYLSMNKDIDKDSLEKLYFKLQDKLQARITDLIPRFDSLEDKHEMLFVMSSFIKDSPDVMELDRGEEGLLSRIKTIGPGLNPAQGKDLAFTTKDYVDKKIALRMQRQKEDLVNSLKVNPFNIQERIVALRALGRLNKSQSYVEMMKDMEELQSLVTVAEVDPDAKQDTREILRELREWKIYELYHAKAEILDRRIDSLNDEARRVLAPLVEGIHQARRVADVRNIESRVSLTQQTSKDISADLWFLLKEVVLLKSKMVLNAEIKNLEAQLRTINLAKYETRDVNELLAGIVYGDPNKTASREEMLLQTGALERSIENTLEKGFITSRERNELVDTLTEIQSGIRSNLSDAEETAATLLSEDELAEAIDRDVRRLSDRVDSLAIPKDEQQGLKEALRGLSVGSKTGEKTSEELYGVIGDIEKETGKILANGNMDQNTYAYFTQHVQGLKDSVGYLMQLRNNQEENIKKNIEGLNADLDAVGLSNEKKEPVKALLETLTDNKKPADVTQKKEEALKEVEKKIDQLLQQEEVDQQTRDDFKRKVESLKSALDSSSKKNRETVPQAKKGVVSSQALRKSILRFIQKTIILLSFILLSCFALGIGVLYFLRERKKRQLLRYWGSPNVFIVHIYQNLQRIVAFYGLRYEKYMPFLRYAAGVQSRYSFSDDLFLRITEKYEEAKYSRHVLQLADVAWFLEGYNASLMLLKKQNKIFRGIKAYCLGILYMVPFRMQKNGKRKI